MKKGYCHTSHALIFLIFMALPAASYGSDDLMKSLFHGTLDANFRSYYMKRSFYLNNQTIGQESLALGLLLL
ncbi:MAG: hypothetical protein C0392_05645 [Syntrophus sp. (in: bacteria)]|nr:hypothetical protein [Syntrophus sp. (in: bacteria)]